MDNETLQVHPLLAKDWYPEDKVAPVVKQEPQTQAPQEVYQDEVESEQVAQEAAPEQARQAVEEDDEPQVNSVKENMRMLREKAKRAERERDELYNMLKQQMERQQPYSAPQPKQEVEEDDDYGYRDDSIVEGKDINKLRKELRALKKEMSRSSREAEQQSMAIAIEAKIRATYPDFDKIVNRDSIEMLNSTDPILANTLSRSPDLYDKAISTYNVIKKYNLHKQDEYYDNIKLKENKSKPRSLASVTAQQHQTSPLSKMNVFAGEMTEELRKALLKDMDDAISKKHLR